MIEQINIFKRSFDGKWTICVLRNYEFDTHTSSTVFKREKFTFKFLTDALDFIKEYPFMDDNSTQGYYKEYIEKHPID